LEGVGVVTDLRPGQPKGEVPDLRYRQPKGKVRMAVDELDDIGRTGTVPEVRALANEVLLRYAHPKVRMAYFAAIDRAWSRQMDIPRPAKEKRATQ
jgi:hypothetical protein